MKAFKEKTEKILIFINPLELRILADIIEAQAEKALVGDDLTIKDIRIENSDAIIRLVIDQDYINLQKIKKRMENDEKIH